MHDIAKNNTASLCAPREVLPAGNGMLQRWALQDNLNSLTADEVDDHLS